MTVFADIHIHMLYHTDDGPRTREQMLAMLEQACAAGTRLFCVTPHFHYGLFGDNAAQAQAAFAELREAAARLCPEAAVVLGNELRWGPSAVEWLDRGACNTLNGTRYVLVDFHADESAFTIKNALYRLLNAGYHPILAHAERYGELYRRWDLFDELKNKGVLIQLDADSVLGNWTRQAKQMGLQLLKRRCADLVCSDAHDLSDRPPDLTKAFALISRRFGTDYAEQLFYRNAAQIIFSRGALYQP